MRGQMTKSPLHLAQVLVLVIAAGCALPVAAQDAGPMPPAPPAAASAPASQPATQKPQDGTAGAPVSGQTAPAAGTDAASGTAPVGTGAAGSAAPAANGATSSAGAPAVPAGPAGG